MCRDRSFFLNAIFGELVDQGASEDVIEESIQVLHELAVGGLLPCCAPEDGEALDLGQQRAIAVGELRRRNGFRSHKGMQGHDAQRQLAFSPLREREVGFLANGAGGHSGSFRLAQEFGPGEGARRNVHTSEMQGKLEGSSSSLEVAAFTIDCGCLGPRVRTSPASHILASAGGPASAHSTCAGERLLNAGQ